jgi:hypothetical protein
MPRSSLALALRRVPRNIRDTGCLVDYAGGVITRIRLPEAVNPRDMFWYHVNEDYLSCLEVLLCRLSLAVRHRVCNFYIRLESVVFRLSCEKDEVSIDFISVRPSLQGRRIATMLIWVTVTACRDHKVARFVLYDCYKSMRSLIGSKFKDLFRQTQYTLDRTILLDDMGKITLESCGLQGRLAEDPARPGFYRINPIFFPPASKVNDTDKWTL